MCRRICAFSLIFAFTMDISKVACRGGSSCTLSYPSPVHVVYSSVPVLTQTLSQMSYTITLPTNQSACRFPPSSRFFSLRLHFISSKSLILSTTMLVRAADCFPFPSPQAYPPLQQLLIAGEGSTGSFQP